MQATRRTASGPEQAMASACCPSQGGAAHGPALTAHYVVEKRCKHFQQQGYSLLELLVVVGLLAATAYIVTGTYIGVAEDSEEQMVRSEMQEIAKALKQFKQDTGYYPKEGPFGLEVDNGSVQDEGLPTYITDTLTNDDDKRRWFYSPANFYQLLANTSPLADNTPTDETDDHPLAKWNPETGRGWRGPYLSGFKDGYVDINDSINRTAYTAIAADTVTGDPCDASLGEIIQDISGLADPFLRKPLNAEMGTPTTPNQLEWNMYHRPVESVSSEPEKWEQWKEGKRKQWGRPYLFFKVFYADASSVPSGTPYTCSVGSTCWYLVSLGPDGEYGDFASADEKIRKQSGNNILLLVDQL